MSNIKWLVVNGCSYMDDYAIGLGHTDLAKRLNIPNALSIAQPGCNNSRIIRTTLKHSYSQNEPVLYVLGVTFVNRREIAVLTYRNDDDNLNGRWFVPSTQHYLKSLAHPNWSDSDSKSLEKLNLKEDSVDAKARPEDLMYSLLSLIDSLHHRGHKVLIFNTADNSMLPILNYPSLALLKSTPCIIDGLNWRSIVYQDDNGVGYNTDEEWLDSQFRHRTPGEHRVLNEFLENYIKNNPII